jgi:hypothetical protein
MCILSLNKGSIETRAFPTKSSSSSLQEVTFNFENDFDKWYVRTDYSDSYFQLESEKVYEGNFAARLNGSTISGYNITENFGSNLQFTNHTKISFAWRFENREAHYIGISLYCPDKHLTIYIMSHFSGTYINNSNNMVIQYKGEITNKWYYHTLDLSKLLREYYGWIPTNISVIELFCWHSLSVKNQTGYFDAIRIWNEGYEDPLDEKLTPVNQVYLDLEKNIETWDINSKYSSSEFFLDDSHAYAGRYSGRLSGTIYSRYNFTKNLNSYIPFTQSTFLSFAWRFENRETHYVGIRVLTPQNQPNLFVMSLFNGIFANISGYIVIQYRNENVSTWYHHSLNLTDIYHSYYGFIPDRVLAIDILNYHSLGQTEQVSNFDVIRVWNKENEKTIPLLISFPLHPATFFFLILSCHKKRKRRKSK